MSSGPIPGTPPLYDSNPDDLPKIDMGPPSRCGLEERLSYLLIFALYKTLGLSLVLGMFLGSKGLSGSNDILVVEKPVGSKVFCTFWLICSA
jgi:hypothetical protein